MADAPQWRTGREDMQSFTLEGEPFASIYADDPQGEIHEPTGIRLPETVARVFGADNKARARLIVAAVNHHAEMLALLRDYAHRGRDIVDPSASSLIGRTRALLGRLECSAPTPKETAMDFDAFRDRLKARLAKLRERLGHDDPDVQAMEKELEDGTAGSGESQAGRQAP